jgi:hypothetical protein
MPDSTGVLINALTNPPDPFARLGTAVNSANALMQYQADQAAAQAYRQNIDENGNLDQAGFNRDMRNIPGGTWNFGRQMMSTGEGVSAQARGGSADIQTKLDQQAAISTYLTPLTEKIFNNQKISGQEMSDLLATMPPGLIPPTRMKEIQTQIERLGPTGDATNLARGAMFSNQQAMDRLRMQLPHPDIYNQGTAGIPLQRNPLAPGGSTFPTRPIITGPTPGEAMTQFNILNGPVQGGWISPKSHQQKNGTLYEWYQDHDVAIPPGIGSLRPGPDGTFTLPGIPGGETLRVTPPPPETAASESGQIAGGRPGTGGGYRPPPASGGRPGRPPEPSGYNNPPPPERRGGSVVPPPRTIAAGEEAYNADVADLPASQDRAFRLRQAQAAMEGAKTGRGTEGLQTLNSLMGTWAPEFVTKGLGISPREKAANYDEAAKYYQQIANASFPGGASTNEKLSSAITASPNTLMSDLAAKEITQVMIAGEEMSQYVRQKLIEAGVPPADYAKAKAKWALDNDPRAFILQHLPADKLDKLNKEIASGSPSGKKLKATILQAVQDGAIPDPRGQ